MDEAEFRKKCLDMWKHKLISEVFAIPAFEDYVVARWSYINELDRQFFWSSLQCIEKLQKSILVANEVDTRNLGHKIVKMAKILQENDGLGILNRSFQTFQAKEGQGASTIFDFIANIERYGSASTRYRLNKTLVMFNDLARLDETVHALVELGANSSQSSLMQPSFGPVYEHTKLTASAHEALIQGNPFIDDPNKKPIKQSARFKQPSICETRDSQLVVSEAIVWFSRFAKTEA